MTHLSAISRSKNGLLIGVLLAILLALALVGSVAASWWHEDNSTVNGTVEDTDWEGRASVGWKAPVPPGIIQYGGEGFTEAESVVEELYVHTLGAEYCGTERIDIDWNKNAYTYEDWILGRSGRGSARSIDCLWHWVSNVSVTNEVNHGIWDGEESDSGWHMTVLLADLNP